MRLVIACLFCLLLGTGSLQAEQRPNIVLVMADDMGWAQTGYYNHPVLKTPNLDAMAKNGLRFDRFYAGAPNCSPTRATVMTGRSHDRTGVLNHGYALHRQEKTIAQALKSSGYATAHFGKWHLNGFSGPGAPIFADDTHHPGVFGFDQWLSVTNFFDRNPILSRNGKFEEFQGDSSEIIVSEALEFIGKKSAERQPFFTVIWYGSPHSPFVADDQDMESFAELTPNSKNHYGELVAMDRSIGTLRRGLKELGIDQNTIVWFCSDNGGLPEVKPSSVGHLRGFKGTVYEGGLRVPAIVEWPAKIPHARVSNKPSGTLDIFPTIMDLLQLPESGMLAVRDGISLKSDLLNQNPSDSRSKPIPFRHQNRGALVDNHWKLVKPSPRQEFELYNLTDDPSETKNLADSQPVKFRELLAVWNAFSDSVDQSQKGMDYPEGRVKDGEPGTRPWVTQPQYQALFDQWVKRPEYRSAIEQFLKPTPRKKKAR